MTTFRKLRMMLLVLLALAGVLAAAAPAHAGPYWTGCRPDIDPDTLEISTICY